MKYYISYSSDTFKKNQVGSNKVGNFFCVIVSNNSQDKI